MAKDKSTMWSLFVPKSFMKILWYKISLMVFRGKFSPKKSKMKRLLFKFYYIALLSPALYYRLKNNHSKSINCIKYYW